MARTRSASDDPMVELLEPNVRAFGGNVGEHDLVVVDDDVFGHDADSSDEAPRPRWLTVAAVLGVLALLVGGVVAASPWSGDATAPTTTPPTTVADSGTTQPTIGLPGAPGLVIDPPPSDFELRSAISDVGIVGDDAGWGEVWAEPGATRTSGRWFSLTLLPFRSPDQIGDRVDVDGRDGWWTEGIDGVATLQFDAGQTDAARLVMLTAHGFDRAGLIALGASVAIVDDRPQMADDRPVLQDESLFDGLVQVAARSTDLDLLDRHLLPAQPSSVTAYTHAGDDGVVLLEEVPLGERDPALDALSATRIPSLPDGWGVSPDFDGSGLELGNRSLFGRSMRVATWQIDDDTEVIVLSTLELDDFVRELHLVRRATSTEWADAVDTRIDLVPSDATGIGFVLGSDRTRWAVTSAVTQTVTLRNRRSFELWATPGATRTTGAWMAVHAPVVPVLSVDPSAVRVVVGNDVGVLTTAADGVSTLRIGSFDDGVDITSFGWSLAEVVALTATFPHGADQLVDVASIRSDHVPLVVGDGRSESLAWEIFRDEQAITHLRRADGALVTVVVQPDDEVTRSLLPFVIDAPDRTAASFAGGSSWRSALTFVDQGQRVIAYSTLTPDELDIEADDLERAPPQSWAALLRLGPASFEAPSVALVPVAEGDTTSGVAWTVSVDSVSGATALLGFEITDGTAGSSRSVALAERPLTLGQAGPATLAVWTFLPDEAPASATSVVVTGDGWERAVPLVGLGGPRGLRAAALVFSELGGFSWGLLDDDGTSVSPIHVVG